MIISMKPGATKDQINGVCDLVRGFKLEIHSIQGAERSVIAVVGVGDQVQACMEAVQSLDAVESVQRITAPYKRVSRQGHPESSLIKVNGVTVGGGEFVVMAGPCSVESERQIMETAEAVAKAGARVLRGGAFKPRTSPYDFQGLGMVGLKLLAKAKRETNLDIITEVMTPEMVEVVAAYADILQVGARNMQNFELLKTLGSKCNKAVMLKNGLSSTLQDLLMAAEYIVANGNPNVILCLRGIRTFETTTRNTLDIGAVTALKELTHLPIIVDPSHATGKRSLVASVSRAAVAVGADGIMVEVHPHPEKATSDGAQSLHIPEFQSMMGDLKPYIKLWEESRRPELQNVAV